MLYFLINPPGLYTHMRSVQGNAPIMFSLWSDDLSDLLNIVLRLPVRTFSGFDGDPDSLPFLFLMWPSRLASDPFIVLEGDTPS